MKYQLLDYHGASFNNRANSFLESIPGAYFDEGGWFVEITDMDAFLTKWEKPVMIKPNVITPQTGPEKGRSRIVSWLLFVSCQGHFSQC